MTRIAAQSRSAAFPRALVAILATGLTLTVLPTSLAVASPADPALRTKITKVMQDSRARAATTSLTVRDATDGRELYALRGDRLTMPASNTKILTAAAALHELGAGYTFKTDVIRRDAVSGGVLGGNLYLKGYGDPTTRQSDFRYLAQRVRAQGIRTVTGALVADASFFDNQVYNPNWKTSYSSAYYAAEVTGLTVAPNADLDSGTVYVSYAARKKGQTAKITFSPAGAASAIRLVNKTTSGKKGSGTSVSVRRAYASSTITVSGKVAAGRGGTRIITVHRPDLVAAAVFRRELTRAGVTVRQATVARATPAGRQTRVARDLSMPLARLMVPYLKLSNNMHAEALTKAMGAKNGRPGSWASGLARTRAYLATKGVGPDAVRLVDGSGLTRGNRISSRAMTRLLVAVQKERWFDAFYAGLPVAGNYTRMVGGTLRHRMNGTRAANNAHAKTGTLTGVTGLSGYVTGRDGRRYVFAMLSEYRGRSPRPVENTVVQALANWRR